MRTEVRFELAGGDDPLLLVPSHVNERGPYQFIVDTGASVSLIAPQLARDLNLARTSMAGGMGAGGQLNVALAYLDKLAVGEAALEKVQVAISEELHRIGAAINARVDGNLGYNFLKNFRLKIDYARSTFTLARVQPFASDWVGASLDFKLAGPARPLILIPAFVNNRGPYQFALDTGASKTVLAPEVVRGLELQNPQPEEITGVGGKIPSIRGEIALLQIGSHKRSNVTVVVTEMLTTLSQVVQARLDGIIGYTFLKAFNVTIDYPNAMLRLAEAS